MIYPKYIIFLLIFLRAHEVRPQCTCTWVFYVL